MQDSNSIPRAGPHLSVRTLKIEPHGDFSKGLIKAKIRLIGRWLEEAGFRPGHHVRVTCVAPGVIELRSAEAVPVGEAKPELSEQSDRSR